MARRRGGGVVGVVDDNDEGVGGGVGVPSDPVGESTAPKNPDKVSCKVSESLSYQDPA
jgi:hypothetical protein